MISQFCEYYLYKTTGEYKFPNKEIADIKEITGTGKCNSTATESTNFSLSIFKTPKKCIAIQISYKLKMFSNYSQLPRKFA